MAKIDLDFRRTFGEMSDHAVITRGELASLISTTIGAISQMQYRGELPQTAFVNKRRAVWFVRDIRKWLDEMAQARTQSDEKKSSIETHRIGRPRMPS